MTATRILIFAKAPVPGRVKTRLIPALGAEGAARLARCMLAHTLAQARMAGLGPVELCASPGLDHPDWAGCSLPAGVVGSDQGEGDLGERMSRAIRRRLPGDERLLLIGTDCPALGCQHLREAAAALDGNDATLYPTADGGFQLLGLHRFQHELFLGIPWSTPAVASLILARIRSSGWSVTVGQTLHDIDLPADLTQLPEHMVRAASLSKASCS